MKYRTILADPPWPERGGGQIRRGAQKHYPLMTVTAVLALAEQVKAATSPAGCHLYLWVTNGRLPDGLRVMAAWGFRYITTITWLKNRAGLGQYFRGVTEHCLFGVAGPSAVPWRPNADANEPARQGLTGFYAPRTAHSVKPPQLREMAERVSLPPRLELFARAEVPGWDAWGRAVNTPEPDAAAFFDGLREPV